MRAERRTAVYGCVQKESAVIRSGVSEIPEAATSTTSLPGSSQILMNGKSWMESSKSWELANSFKNSMSSPMNFFSPQTKGGNPLKTPTFRVLDCRVLSSPDEVRGCLSSAK
jgi:hypothetical protein